MISSVDESLWRRNQERLATGALVLLLVYAVLRNGVKAAIRPFWFDEICTWIVTRQPSLASLWRSLAHAVDGQPPPYYLLERIFDRLIPSEHIAFRLPSILAFCLMEWCLFVWLKKRHSVAVAFVAVLLPFVTILFDTYTVEARPYCLLAACLSVALVAYQRVPAVTWTLALGLSLAIAESIHYYAVFVAAPFFAAEAVFFLKTKSFRWRVWLALSVVIVPILAFWPILSNFKAYYAGHYWNHPTLLVALRVYGWLLELPQGKVDIFSWPLVAGYLVTASVLAISALLILQAFRANPDHVPAFHERVLIAGFLLLPVLLYVVTKFSGGGYTPRYLLPVTIGFVLLAALGFSQLSGKSLALVGAALFLGFAIKESEFWFSFSTEAQLGFPQPKPLEQLVTQSRSSLPVVIADFNDFMQIDHYAAPAWKPRLNYLADQVAAVAHGRPDTGEKEVLALSEFAPMRVFALKDFVAVTPKFLLYSDPKADNDPDWWVVRLVEDGYSVKNLATDGHNTLYLVELKHVE